MLTQISTKLQETYHMLLKINGYLLSQLCTSQKEESSIFKYNEDFKIYHLTIQIDSNIKRYIKYQQESISNYQKLLQNFQEKLRKHAKNQIEMKLYYEHLEQSIQSLKSSFARQREAERVKYESQIDKLRNELAQYQNTTTTDRKVNEEPNKLQTQKMDTLTKIKQHIFNLNNDDHELFNHPSNLQSKRDSLVKEVQEMIRLEPKSKTSSNNSSLNTSLNTKIVTQPSKKTSKEKSKEKRVKNNDKTIKNKLKVSNLKTTRYQKPKINLNSKLHSLSKSSLRSNIL